MKSLSFILGILALISGGIFSDMAGYIVGALFIFTSLIIKD
jgi:hypothetical protein